MPTIKCVICREGFKPVIKDQACCSATCAKAGGFKGELKAVQAVLFEKLNRACREAKT